MDARGFAECHVGISILVLKQEASPQVSPGFTPQHDTQQGESELFCILCDVVEEGDRGYSEIVDILWLALMLNVLVDILTRRIEGHDKQYLQTYWVCLGNYTSEII